ncbi:MAG: hypothetical protein FJW39_27110 [Acidobacteria bacterium]|nr:hypothetical protein [Acidobacteriota bacterium]
MRYALLAAFAVSLAAQRPDSGPSPRPNPAREGALAEIVPVTTGEREDDHPAVASRNGTVWTAWVSYSETEGSSHVFVRSWSAGKWSPAERVTESGGDYHKPAICIDEQDTVWVAWPAQTGGNWDLSGRRRSRAGAWTRVERWTTDPAPDFFPALAASGGRVMLVWQTMRRGNMDIFHKVSAQGNWGAEAPVSESPASDWEPVIAATRDGFAVAWDSFRGDYDVLLRTWRAGGWGAEMAVARTAKLENHASLAADDQGRVWIGYEVGPENWAADSANDGLRPRREIGLACLRDGKLFSVPAPVAPKDGFESPMITAVGGSVRLFLRKPMNKNWEWVGSSVWEGPAWSQPEWLLYSEGRIDQRVVAADAGGGRVMAVYPAGSSHNVIYSRVYAAGARDAVPPLTEIIAGSLKSPPVPTQPHMFRGHRLVWGDLHRHTDISEDGGLRDGSLIDAMRYSVDAAGLDFIGITDHTRYLPRRYNLWRIQQIADLLYKPGMLTPLHAYERSQYTPWGHRNVVHLDRNFTPVPASYDLGDPGVSPWGLFDALRGKRAMSIPHTSAWGNKQVSWDYFDPQVERLVELYQGLRSTYEYNGAPDPADRAVYEKDSKNFVWDALARGRKLGFIASSDHGSTHMSFAAVYVKSTDRAGVFEGLTARRTYAATDKILLDMAVGNALMGEETVAAGAPEVRVAVEGTADVERVDVIRNGGFAYTVEPKARKVAFTFRDSGFDGKESYYYVRVIQVDKQMAWGSPVWVRR